MNDAPLPADLRDWPEDPGELFGVDYNVDRKTLRRVYSRLVKHYKPEHAPEKFQRIREAYESMLQHVQWREQYGDFDDDEHDEDSQPTGDSTEGFTGGDVFVDNPETGSAEEFDTEPQNGAGDHWISRGHVPGVEDFWNQAASGKLAPAYRGMRNLHERRPAHEETCIRLYWMLKVAPHLDDSREAIDWLVTALKNNGLGDWALGLYWDELKEDPSRALESRLNELIRVPATPWNISQVVRAHWTAAAARRDYPAIIDNLDSLRTLLIDDDAETWLRILFNTLDHLCWAAAEGDRRVAAAVGTVQREIQSFEYLQLSMSFDFDRCENLLTLTEDSRRLRGNLWCPELPGLLSYGWNAADGDLRAPLHRLVEPWVINPARGLDVLDEIAKRSPAAVERLADMLNTIDVSHAYFDEEDSSHTVVEQALWNLLAAERWPDYQSFRPAFCDFCVAESLPLHFIGNVIASNPERFAIIGDEFVHELSEDAALDCLIRANLAFWA